MDISQIFDSVSLEGYNYASTSVEYEYNEEMVFEMNIGDSTNNLKGIILPKGGTTNNVYIGIKIEGEVYYLTIMPNLQSQMGNPGDMGVAFLPLKVNSSTKLSDIADQNIFGGLYNMAGTMSQNFAIKSSLNNLSTFRLGYASNVQLNRTNSYSLVSRMLLVPETVGMKGTQIPISVFGTKDTSHEGDFKMVDDFNLSVSELYAGVNYRFSFTGGPFYIPVFPLVDTNKISTTITYPENFIGSTGVNSNLINSTLFQRGNCSTSISTDPRDILKSYIDGELTEVTFTNSNDCTVGINYDYCPTGVTCTGNCYSSCPIGTCTQAFCQGSCKYNTDIQEYNCTAELVMLNPALQPLNPALAEIVAVSADESIALWIGLIVALIIIVVIIFALMYYSKNSKTEAKAKAEAKNGVVVDNVRPVSTTKYVEMRDVSSM